MSQPTVYSLITIPGRLFTGRFDQEELTSMCPFSLLPWALKLEGTLEHSPEWRRLDGLVPVLRCGVLDDY